MNAEAITALRQVIYYQIKKWDAAFAAEKALDCEIETGERLENFCASFGDAEDALDVSEEDLKDVFDLKGEGTEP